MEKDKNLEKQAEALKEEDLDSVAGGMRTSGSGNPDCPKCGTEMGIRMTGFYACPKCGYAKEATVVLMGKKG